MRLYRALRFQKRRCFALPDILDPLSELARVNGDLPDRGEAGVVFDFGRVLPDLGGGLGNLFREIGKISCENLLNRRFVMAENLLGNGGAQGLNPSGFGGNGERET